MKTLLLAISFIVVSYLAGSLPIGFWAGQIAKGKDFDIRKQGSGGTGATNVLRQLGWVALPVLVLDVLKGYFSAKLAIHGLEWVGIACLAAACVGHAKSLYFALTERHFSGGKSVATALGGILALQPVVAGSALVVYIVVIAMTRYSSLGSLTAAFSTIFISIAIKAPFYWTITFVFIFLMLCITHWRNICNLINGQESKIGKKKAEPDPDVNVAAFSFHSITIGDLQQNRVARILLSLYRYECLGMRPFRKMTLFLISRSPVLEGLGEINFTDNLGDKSKILLSGFPQLPWMLKEPKIQKLFFALLQGAAVLAQRAGALTLGLGALLSSMHDGGALLQKWANSRRLGIAISNGGAATVAAVVIALRKVLAKTCDKTLMIIGSSGVIGTGLRFYYADKFAKIILKARQERKKKSEVTPEEHHTIIVNDLEGLAEADVVILTTSSVIPIIDSSNIHMLKQGCIILDVGRPANFDEEALKLRPDVRLIRCGLIGLPGNPDIPIDFHFGVVEVDGKKQRLVPACLAEQPIIACTKRFDMASRGAKIEPTQVEWFIDQLNDRGYEVYLSSVDERTLFSGGDVDEACDCE